MSDFDQAYQKAKTGIDNFNKKYEKTPYGVFGTAANNGLNEFNKANAAFKSGDTMGGSAAVLRGIGALSAGLVLVGGPVGAAIGAVLGLLTGVIAAILDALKPATDSMISKIEKLIFEQSLREAYNDIKGGIAGWELIEKQIDNLVASGRLITWEFLNQTVPWQEHYVRINRCFSTLQTNARVHSGEWLPLFDLNIIYAMRFWVYLENLSLIFCRERLPPDPDSHEMLPLEPTLPQVKTFYDMRQLAAKNLRDGVLNTHYSSVNEVDFYSLWLSPGRPYKNGVDSLTWQANPIYHRVGALHGSANENLSIGKSICFEIAQSGTFFSAGTNPLTLYAGRPEGGFKAPPVSFGNGLEQLAIGDFGNDKLGVVCVYANGRQLSFCSFDDRSGTHHEKKHGGWTPGDWRWGTWGKLWLQGRSILSLAMQPYPTHWSLYAFTVDRSGNGELCLATWTGDNPNLKMTPFPETHFSKASLTEAMFGFTPEYGRRGISPCLVTCLGDDLFLQVGKRICHRKNGKWECWNAQDVLGISGLAVYQARHYADGTTLFSTNQGVIMQYPNPQNDWKPNIYQDKVIETIWFNKAVSSQALTALQLLIQVTEAAKQPIDHFLGSSA